MRNQTKVNNAKGRDLLKAEEKSISLWKLIGIFFLFSLLISFLMDDTTGDIFATLFSLGAGVIIFIKIFPRFLSLLKKYFFDAKDFIPLVLIILLLIGYIALLFINPILFIGFTLLLILLNQIKF